MPIYEYQCACGAVTEEFRTVAERRHGPECCGQTMTIRLSPTRVMNDIRPYKSMVTGEMIESRSRHRDHLRRHSLVEIGNEVDTLLKPRPKLKLSKEKRKQRIAEILNR